MEFSEQRLKFEVRPEANKEKNFLTCDENLLSEMAELSGGRFFREENFDELKKCSGQSVRKIIITEIVLWQSFGWLAFVVFILGLKCFFGVPACCNHNWKTKNES